MARAPRDAEPPLTDGLLGPALLAAIAMLFVHLAAGAMLGAVAVTLSAGPTTAGGAWDVLVWGFMLVLVAAAASPILRRTRRPLAVGTLAGGLLAAVHTAVATWLVAPGQGTDLVWARVGSLVLVGVTIGWVSARRGPPSTEEPGIPSDRG